MRPELLVPVPSQVPTMTESKPSPVTIHQSFAPLDDSRNDSSTISDTGNIYTCGLHELNLPELVVQGVPRGNEDLVVQMLNRQSKRLQTGCQLYTDFRIMEGNRFFRVIQVERLDHRLNLLDHVMTNWWKGRPPITDHMLSQVQILVLAPWFALDMQEWASLPPAPRGRTECRDRLFLTALSLDCRGRWRPGSYSTQEFSEADAAYFLKHKDHFLQILNVPNVQSFLYRMPPSFQRQVLAVGDRLTAAAALRIAPSEDPNHPPTGRQTSSTRGRRSPRHDRPLRTAVLGIDKDIIDFWTSCRKSA